MLISQAFANDAPATTAITTTTSTDGVAAASASPLSGMTGQFALIGLMFLMFYMLLIRPQQKRLKAQQSMVMGLKIGDKVITGGGLVGTVSRIINDTDIEVDLGGMKVTALRYTLTVRNDAPAA